MKKKAKKRKSRNAGPVSLSVDDRLSAIEARLSSIEKKIDDVSDRAGYASQSADAALYVANYCR